MSSVRYPKGALFGAVALLAAGAVTGTGPAWACGVPLSVQDIQSGIMPSEANLPCQSGGQSAPRPSGPSPAQIERQNRWQRASELNSEANGLADRGQYEEAIARYQQALDLFRTNGDTRNMAITQRNLDLTRKQYDAIKPDNRLSAAQSQYANQNIYSNNKGNPFGGSGVPGAAAKQSAPTAQAPSAAMGGGTECAQILGPNWSWQTVCRPIATIQNTPGSAARSNPVSDAINAAQEALTSLAARSGGPAAVPSGAGAAPQASGSGGGSDTPPRLRLGDVVDAATDACRQTLSGTPERRRCIAIEEARAIMAADPDIAARCSQQGDPNSRVSCALDAYGKKLAHQNAIGDPNCYFLKSGQPCHPGGSAVATGGGAKESLRDRLRREMTQPDRDSTPDADSDTDSAAKSQPQPQPPSPSQQATAPPSPRGDTDDPLQNYLQSQNNNGSINNGTLTNSNPGFRMSGSETDREVNRLQGSEPYGPPVPDSTAALNTSRN